jgi:putative membrane protein
MKLLLGWAINAVALFLLPYLVPAVQVRGFGTALVVALIVGLLNTFIRPVLFILTLPITILTLGLFTLVLNGLMFWIASRLVEGFFVGGFWWAVLAALIYSIISWAISSLLLGEKTKRA